MNKTFVNDYIQIKHKEKELISFFAGFIADKRLDILDRAIEKACEIAGCAKDDLDFFLEIREKSLITPIAGNEKINTVLSSKKVELKNLKIGIL